MSRNSGGQADLGVAIVARSGSRINTMSAIQENDNNAASANGRDTRRQEAANSGSTLLIMARRQSLANGVTTTTASSAMGSKPSAATNQIVNASAELSNDALANGSNSQQQQQPVKTKRNLTFTSTSDALRRKKSTSSSARRAQSMIISDSMVEEQEAGATNKAAAGEGGRTHRSRSTGSRPTFVVGTPPPSDDGKDTAPPSLSTATTPSPSNTIPGSVLPSVIVTEEGDQLGVNSYWNKRFHKSFKKLPPNEYLIDVYSCAYVSDFLTQGYLYVSPNWFCFYANILGYKKKIEIPVSSVLQVTRERTAIIFPNAIGILTSENKYVFGSLLHRKKTLITMTAIWRNIGAGVDAKFLSPDSAMRGSRSDDDISRTASDDDETDSARDSPEPNDEEGSAEGDQAGPDTVFVGNEQPPYQHQMSGGRLKAAGSSSTPALGRQQSTFTSASTTSRLKAFVDSFTTTAALTKFCLVVTVLLAVITTTLTYRIYVLESHMRELAHSTVYMPATDGTCGQPSSTDHITSLVESFQQRTMSLMQQVNMTLEKLSSESESLVDVS